MCPVQTFVCCLLDRMQVVRLSIVPPFVWQTYFAWALRLPNETNVDVDVELA